MKTTLINGLCKLLLVMFTVTMTGCASRHPLSQLQPGTELSIKTTSQDSEANQPGYDNKAVERRISQGHDTGALTGAIVAVSCGPLFLLCLPLTAMVGSSVGLLAGAVIGTSEKIDEQSRTIILDKLSKALEADSEEGQFEKALASSTGKYFTIVENSPNNTMYVRLALIRIENTDDDSIYMYIQYQVDLSTVDNSGEETLNSDFIDYVSLQFSKNQWVHSEQEFYDQLLAGAYQSVANMISAELMAKERKKN